MSIPVDGHGEAISRRTMILAVAFLVVAAHGWSIGTGLYLDDYAHYEHLREGNWSYQSAIDSARLGIVGEVLDLWGRQEAGLKFYRPIAFWIMRAEYTVGQWSPAVMHVFSLGWHLACSLLVGAVATRCLGRRFWGLMAAGLMALHPAHIGTVFWIACQTELLTTLFLLIGILAYSRHAGWGYEPVADAAANAPRLYRFRPWFLASPQGEPGELKLRLLTSDVLVALTCYGLALGCRENAALFPLVCWLGDRLCGSPRRGWLRWEHIGFAGIFGLYMTLRWQALGGFPVPPPPYLMPASASFEFVQYVIYKLVMYSVGLFALVPVVPVGSRNFFAEHPSVFYGVFGGVCGLILAIWAAYRFRRSLLWPMAWTALLIAPVMLVFASPHHLYLPALGMVLLVTAGLAAVAGAHVPERVPRVYRSVLAAVVIFLVTGVVGAVAWAMGFSYVRGVLSEDLVVREVVKQQRPIREGDHLFFVNLPVLAYYAVPAIEQELGLHDLRGHVLVFSPDLIRMESPGRVEVLDRHRLRVIAPKDKRYLSGITGTMLLGVMGIDEQLDAGKEFDAGAFRVKIERADAEGVESLLFTFTKPMDSPEYHFYLGSRQFMAADLSELIAADSQPAP